MSETNRKSIELSPEARDQIELPLEAVRGNIYDARGEYILNVRGTQTDAAIDYELAAFIAALVNEALTPAAPIDPNPITDEWLHKLATVPGQFIGPIAAQPETSIELAQQVTEQLEAADVTPGVPMCAIGDCLNGAAPGYIYCDAHLQRWTAEQVLQREG